MERKIGLICTIFLVQKRKNWIDFLRQDSFSCKKEIVLSKIIVESSLYMNHTLNHWEQQFLKSFTRQTFLQLFWIGHNSRVEDLNALYTNGGLNSGVENLG